MKRVTLLLIGLVFTLGFNAFAKNGNGNGNNNEYITVEKQGNFEDENSWLNGNVPSDFENIDKEMTINGTITRNGNLNPVTVNVNDTLIVDGDYENNQWGGLDIKSGAKVEIFGNLNCSEAVTIAQGGILIVHGNLTSTNAGLLIKGDLVVKGDFSTDSKTQVNNSGNLIVGGDFSHLGGGLNGHSDDIYILDPNANITNPGWGIIYNGEYGDIKDFKRVEEGLTLKTLWMKWGY